MTTTYGGRGTSLVVAHPTTVFVVVSQRVEIDGPDSEMGERDMTHLDSSAHECAPTIVDNGMVTGRCWYHPGDDGQKSMQTLVSTPSTLASPGNGLSQFKIILATTTKFFAFDGFVKKWKPGNMNNDGTIEAEWAVRVSGAVTYPTT
jgi:hypothetical protein